MRSPAANAELALLLEVAGTPKPGNVDRHRDLAELRFEHFLAGAVGAREGLELAADGAAVGPAFERAVEEMAAQKGGNTQFGALLLLVPLVRAARDDLSQPVAEAVVRETTVGDAASFYRAFDHVDVAVGDPPTDADALDVRRGSDATPALREREVTLRDVMALSAEPADPDHADDPDRIPDRNAQEWAEGFPRTFRAAEWIQSDEGPMTDRAARAFLGLLAAESDTLIAANHGPETAREASERAGALLGGDRSTSGNIDATAVHDADRDAAEELAAAFVDEGINPGTTADLTCAALYVALRHGTVVSP